MDCLLEDGVWCELLSQDAVYTLRRFMDNGLRAPAVYKLPLEFMTSGDENAKG